MSLLKRKAKIILVSQNRKLIIQFGISASRLKDQFKHGRFNLRQKAIDVVGLAGKE